MNSVDDSSVVTPNDTSTPSSPDSTSSEFSQPTVKMRIGADSKNRRDDRILAIGGHDPFFRSLDKDGRRLVETTGRTAQRSRASIRERSRADRQMSYRQPRKSRSSTRAVSFERRADRRVEKRHSYDDSESPGKSLERSEIEKIDPKETDQAKQSRSNTDQWPSSHQPRKSRSSTSASSLDRSANRSRIKKHHSYGAESSGKSREKPISPIGNFFPEKIPPRTVGSPTDPKVPIDRPKQSQSTIDQWPTCHQPRKSRSSTTAGSLERSVSRRVKKRHSYGAETSRRSWEKSEKLESPKRYSAGDYLRQQIVEDLMSTELLGKTEEEIAEDRCNRVKAYLRRRGNDWPQVAPETRLRELREWTRVARATATAKANRRRDLDRVRSFLQEKIRAKMNQEKWRQDDWSRWSSNPVDELSLQDIRTRYSDYQVGESNFPGNDYQVQRVNFPTRRVRSDVNIAPPSSSDSGRDDSKAVTSSRRGKPCRRTRSEIVPEQLIDYEDNEIKTRFYSFLGGRRNSWKTRSGLTFEKKLSLPNSRTDVNLDAETDDDRKDRNERKNRDESYDKKKSTKYCRRTRSDSVTLSQEIGSSDRGANRRSVSWSDRRKSRGKMNAKSVVGALDSTSMDDEADVRSVKRSKGQQVIGGPCSWREYKERARREQLRRESEKIGSESTVRTPVAEKNRETVEETKKSVADDATKTNENSEPVRSSDNANDTETETILQENYLLLDPVIDRPDLSYRSPTISRLQVNEYADLGTSPLPDRTDREIGDNCDEETEVVDQKIGMIGFNAKSNVKKSDTFRIVDGSEKIVDRVNAPIDSDRFFGGNDYATRGRNSEGDESSGTIGRTNRDIADDYFRRVYELLKQRQEARRGDGGCWANGRRDSDTSTANCEERDELRRRRRRRRRDKNCQGEDAVAVSPGVRGVHDDDDDDAWRVQQLLVNNDPESLIFRRPQLPNAGHKRPRHPAPPIPANCRINAKDISKYFDYPNKENSSPRNGAEGKRNELIEQQQQRIDSNEAEMGSNLSRHNGKGLTGRRTQSSGNLCDPKGKLNHVGKILVPCSSTQRERYKICGSLPNHLDDKEILDDDDARENNNTISDTMVGNFGGTLPHKKRSLGVHFSDTGPTGALDLVKHRSQDSLEGDPWRYQEGVDLDLVRCKHGNYDVVRKNPSVDVVDGDTSSSRAYSTLGRSSEGRCFRSADLDLVGTLPKRRPGESCGGSALRLSFEARQNRTAERLENSGGGGSSDLLIKVPHKPDCDLAKRLQFDRVVDLKLGRLASGEPQDQGYASERSPEDEHPPTLPGQPFPKVTPEDTFRVTLQKSSRGLGLSVSGGGTAGPVRVKRLFPQQPAALSKKLQSGDILLAANGVPLTGLTNYEALEVLRTTPSTVELVVCRVPGDTSVTSPGAPPPPPARREPPSSLRILNPQPPLQIEPCGEFDIEMTKVAGSLGFTLRKVDSSALGHYVRALVREPALSDGRIQPGDKIVSVDGEPLSPMSHEEAVALLRRCGPRVKLRLYRDLAQTPVSALSPTEPDHPLRPPRTSLRQEAVDMLCDLAVRKLSPDASNGANSRQTSAASCHSPRRLRKPLSRTPTTENDNENHLTFHPVHSTIASQAEASDTDQCSIKTQATNSQSETPANDIIDPPPLYDVCDSSDSSRAALSRPSFLDLTARPEKPHFRFSLESESDYTGPIVVTESDSNLTAECDYDDELAKESAPAAGLSSDEPDNNLPSEPASMPPLLSATRTASGAFSYKNPAYQSANPTCGGIDSSAKIKNVHSSDQDIPGKVLGAEDPAGSKGLLKWKGVMFAPNDEAEETVARTEAEEAEKPTTTEVSTRNVTEDGNEVFTVELTRGWNSRLGFSLQPEGSSTVISVVHPDSVAAKDGRLMEGDVLIMVNDESVENMPTAEIIDLLRKIRGSIGITVRRKNKTKNVS